MHEHPLLAPDVLVLITCMHIIILRRRITEITRDWTRAGEVLSQIPRTLYHTINLAYSKAEMKRYLLERLNARGYIWDIDMRICK